jgi:glucose-1-phosphatase
MQIQNLIFDFGNVLFDLDLPAIPRGFRALFGDRYEAALGHLQQKKVFELYETGGLSTDEFVDSIRLAGGTPALEAEAVIEVWNSIFVNMPDERLDMLLRLRERYRVFMLSNINELHADWIDTHLAERGIHDFFTRYFDGVYYSHLIRLRKPDLEAYEYVLADAELKAEASAFIDDLPDNVAAAERAGIRGIWHEPGTDIVVRMARF